ncbi:hypothetical protein EJB05_28981 [Eragrostis curvula]|uniref:F-box domain-containing protein n=1 Tax=Eragrostis curvula TaxID=38414 RepID=A0A5J9USR5_9POAL|nr:hypothetical protein EJB05_28981 [Eragrostis curvula]
MPPGREGRKVKKQHEARGIDALPDGVLEHILGFLPAEEAVRTCVLARRWRHRWKFAAALRIISTGGEFLAPADKLREFMDHLLLGRGGAALDSCELRIGDRYNVLTIDDVLSRVEHWFRHAVECRVQVIRLLLHLDTLDFLELDDLPLVSNHLTRLELHGVEVRGSFLNFSGCPNLQYLEFESCHLLSESTALISFQSLKHLRIMSCALSRVHISAPNLVSLVLHEFWESTPTFETMPSLMEASINIIDCGVLSEFCNCESCCSKGYVLLEGLSKAKSLLLISQPTMGPKHKLELEGSISPIGRSPAISEDLKTVKVKCEVFDERIVKVLRFLRVFTICFRYEMRSVVSHYQHLVAVIRIKCFRHG